MGRLFLKPSRSRRSPVVSVSGPVRERSCPRASHRIEFETQTNTTEPAPMERWVGRVALVTGASAGIGAAICESLVEHGLVVVGCARNVAKIQQVGRSKEFPGPPSTHGRLVFFSFRSLLADGRRTAIGQRKAVRTSVRSNERRRNRVHVFLDRHYPGWCRRLRQ